MPDPREELADRLRRQAAECAAWGSPFYGNLLQAAAADVEDRGPVWELLGDFAEKPRRTMIALRLMGAVHRLVLKEALPELSRHYPSTGGDGDAAAAWPVFQQAVADRRDELHAFVERGCQTNEVGRSAALIGGFLEVAHRTGLPLRILEIGASAGLNLAWDRYRYESPAGSWGDPSSPVRFAHSFEVAPPFNRAAEVAERKGCDLNPIDPTLEEGALVLRSLIWADQLSRLALLDGAIEVARQSRVEVEKANAADFLERELGTSRDEVATVVYHSIFWLYVNPEDRLRIAEAIARARVFELAFEPAEPRFEIRLNGDLLGTSHPHGTGVRWNVDSSLS
ncbi:MAG TPA: DUF2332 domain-containing protein [Candidatus Dormibacteraeota bacterium]|nr:DUF2332 domain-containing protein [Candidatus Dormibacteraeota bacterium]